MKLVSRGVGGDYQAGRWESLGRRRRAAYDNIIILTWVSECYLQAHYAFSS